MNRKIVLLLVLGVLALASNSFAAWHSTTESIKKLNSDFGQALQDGKFPGAFILYAEGFVTRSGKPMPGITPDCIRLWLEGLFTTLVAEALYPIIENKKTLFLSGYGGNGASVFNIVKHRVKSGETGTLLLLPSSDGSRGNNGIIKGSVHSAYDALEADFRKWNEGLYEEVRVKIITVTDMSDFKDTPIPGAFFKIGAAQEAIEKHLADAKSLNVHCEQDEECIAEYKRLRSDLDQYYTNDHKPGPELTKEITELLVAKLQSLKSTKFDTCFEGYLGQAYDAKLTAVTHPVLDFLVALPKSTVVVSVDYPVGLTDKGFQRAHAQYRPHTMIVIFLKNSILAKNDKGDFDLEGVRIVQIDWNTVASVSGMSLSGTYSRPPANLVQKKRIHVAGFTYRTLIGMKTDADKAEWEIAASAEIKPTQDSSNFNPFHS